MEHGDGSGMRLQAGVKAGKGEQAAEGSKAEAGRKVACSPPALAYCQPYVPAASLAADVSQCLPLPRCQVSQQTLPAHTQPRGCPGELAGRKTLSPWKGLLGSHRVGLPTNTALWPRHHCPSWPCCQRFSGF